MAIDLLTLQDVAEALRLAERTVYAMAAAGELPAFKIRGQWRVRRMDLEAWVANKAGGTDETTPEPSSTTASVVAEHATVVAE